MQQKSYEAEVDIIRWQNGEAEGAPCPVCGDTRRKEFVLQVPNPFPYSKWLDLYRCLACQSCFYHPIEVPQYEDDYGYKNYIKFYLEQGAGIDFMIAPIVRLAQGQSFRSLLDVGCGFGFTVDFASQIFGWEAVGVEPSRYGKAGAEHLGVRIYHDYVQNVADLQGQKFDVVFSSEVIEHVRNPGAFVDLLKSYLSESGTLVLTTPNARWIRESTRHSTLLEILYIGFHLVLLSPQGLEIILRKAGFREIRVEERFHRLIAYAGTAPIDLGKEEGADITKDAYIRYLKTLLGNKKLQQDALYDGAAYRLFKEMVNDGKYEEAAEIFQTLEISLVGKYGASVLDPEKTASMTAAISSLDELGEYLPYNLAGVYFYLGMLNLNHTKNYDYASALFKGGFQISFNLLSLGTAYYEELADLLWQMKYHEGLADLYRENRNDALQKFQFILNSREKTERFFHITPPEHILVGSLYHSGIAELQQGNLGEAVEWFHATLDEEQRNGVFRMAKETARHYGMALAQMITSGAAKLSSIEPEIEELFVLEVQKGIIGNNKNTTSVA